MKRKQTLNFKQSGVSVTEVIWVQNCTPEDSDIILQLFVDKESGKPVMSTNRDEVQCYQVSEYGDNGRFAYISVSAMKVLIKMGRVRETDSGIYVHLTLGSLVPSLSEFSSAKQVKSLN